MNLLFTFQRDKTDSKLLQYYSAAPVFLFGFDSQTVMVVSSNPHSKRMQFAQYTNSSSPLSPGFFAWCVYLRSLNFLVFLLRVLMILGFVVRSV